MKKKESIPGALPEIKIDDMRKKRSVRTTFNLSADAHDTLHWLSRYNRITIKEVFNSLFEHEKSYRELLGKPKKQNAESYDNTTENYRNDIVKTRKTYVISKKTLQTITKLSQDFKLHRDGLLEFAIHLTKFWYLTDRNILMEMHDKALKIIEQYYEEAPVVDIEELLGYDDPVSTRFRLALGYMDKLIGDIKNELNNGEPVEE